VHAPPQALRASFTVPNLARSCSTAFGTYPVVNYRASVDNGDRILRSSVHNIDVIGSRVTCRAGES
jgi:hypothetical protein